jgi:hypothetical protein
MISTYFRIRVWAIAGIALLSCAGGSALSQSKEGTAGFLEHDALTPPLLFREFGSSRRTRARSTMRIAASRPTL